MKRLLFHKKPIFPIIEFNLKSNRFSCVSKFIIFLFFLSSLANAQIYIAGEAKIFGKEEMYVDDGKNEATKHKSNLNLSNEDILTIDFNHTISLKEKKKRNPSAQVDIRKMKTSNKNLSVKIKQSGSKKTVFQYRPLSDPDTFFGAKHSYQHFSLPTEHQTKILDKSENSAVLFKSCTIEKTKILIAEFFNAHTFNSAFYTRPPPVLV